MRLFLPQHQFWEPINDVYILYITKLNRLPLIINAIWFHAPTSIYFMLIRLVIHPFSERLFSSILILCCLFRAVMNVCNLHCMCKWETSHLKMQINKTVSHTGCFDNIVQFLGMNPYSKNFFLFYKKGFEKKINCSRNNS